MSTLAEYLAENGVTPEHIVALGPGHFVVTFAGRPTEEIAVGLRCLSPDEIVTAQAEALQVARQGGREGDDAIERYNEELMLQAVGRATCSPNEARTPFFSFGAESARHQLTPEAVRFLWDQLELAHAAASPLLRPATDDDLAELGALLCGEGALEALTPAQRLRIRRWCRLILSQLVAEPEPDPDLEP